jgi:ankyrin repeat protein
MQRGNALDALLGAKHVDVDARYQHPPFAGWRAFHFASVDRDPEATQRLVAAGCDTTSPAPNELVGTAWLDAIEGLSNNAFTSYVTACKAAPDSVEFLNYRDPAGRTALHVAAILGSGPLVRLMFELGLEDASPSDIAGNTPLSLTIQHAHPSKSSIQALLDLGAKPSAEHVVEAASRGLSRVVALLVAAGAPVPPGVSRRTLKHAVGVATKLRSSAAHAPVLESSVLLNEAIARDDREALRLLLATGAHDVSQVLARAAACGSVRMINMLLAVPGVDTEARVTDPVCAFDGGTALHCDVASYEPRDEQVRLLIAAGANVNAELSCGLRAMDVTNHHRIKGLLAAHGAFYAPYEASAARSTFRTTQRLLVSLQNNDFKEMRLAIVAGADANATDMLGNRALHNDSHI